MQFSRYQRAQSLKTVQMAIQDVIDSRLLDPTYTLSEVQELLQNIQELVHAEIETELISIAHSNVLLLSQMFSQAEKWHLRLTVDLSEIQNRELLEEVKALEVTELTSRNKLQPIADEDSGIALLRTEIERLQQENVKLENTVKDLETQIVQLKEERNKLLEGSEKHEDEIVMLKRNLEDFKLKLETITKESNISPEKTDPEHLLGEYDAVLSEQLRAELESMRQQMLHVQSQLTLAEQELERKFNQTAAYCNMKKMLAKKNEQVKELRVRLQKYESPDDGVSD